MLQRTGVRIVLGLLLLLTPAAARAAEVDQGTGQWAVTLDAVGLYGSPAEDAEVFGRVSAWAPLQILDYAGDWARVYNPRTRGTAFVPSAGSTRVSSESPRRKHKFGAHRRGCHGGRLRLPGPHRGRIARACGVAAAT